MDSPCPSEPVPASIPGVFKTSGCLKEVARLFRMAQLFDRKITALGQRRILEYRDMALAQRNLSVPPIWDFWGHALICKKYSAAIISRRTRPAEMPPAGANAYDDISAQFLRNKHKIGYKFRIRHKAHPAD
jgi:hypothetical protein